MAMVIVMIYIVRLMSLQIFSDDYKASAESNAFYRRHNIPHAA